MERREQSTTASGEQLESEQNKRARLILRYIENHIVGENTSADEQTEAKLKKHYQDKSAKEKTDELYQKTMVFMLSRKQALREKKAAEKKGEEYTAKEINPKLISRIKILIGDPTVQELLPETYGEARVDRLTFRASDLTKKWRSVNGGIIRDEKRLARLRQDVFQEKIKDQTDVVETQSEIAELEEEIDENKQVKTGILALEGYEKTPEHTDNASLFQHETLLKYREQLDAGFMWLPSREDIDARAMRVLESGNPKQTRKGIFFISEPGSGKSEQIRAIAKRLTGLDRIKISCGPRTGEPQILGQGRVFPGATEIEKGTFTDYSKSVSGAWTGYDYSYQKEPVRNSAQVVELDEMPKAFENETFFTLAKGLFALKDGDVMPGTDKKVLPGRVLIGSGNIGQHHGPKTFPPALEREFIVIPVDYLEMTPENPEAYEFMLGALIEKGGIQASKKEMMPAYERIDLPQEKRAVLSDGSVVIAVQELIKDPTDINHGFLYRLAHAVKAVQNSYMARGGENAYIDYTHRDILRYQDNDDGTVSVAETGNQIILGTTITLNDIMGWMIGYKEETKKRNAKNLSESLQIKLKEKIGEKHEDRDKLKAIFDYFHLFEKVSVDSDAKPLTPKEIGYLSPRTPRPVYLERPAATETPSLKPETGLAKEYETREVLLEDGSRVLMKVRGLKFEEGDFDLEAKQLIASEAAPGKKFRIKGDSFVFAGVVEDKNSPHHGQPIGQPASMEKLYKVFSPEELNWGIEEEFKNLIGETGVDDIKNDLLDYWEIEKCHEKHGEFLF